MDLVKEELIVFFIFIQLLITTTLLLEKIKIYKKRKKKKKYKNAWRDKNKNNETVLLRKIPFDIISVGKRTYGNLEVYYWGNPKEALEIGNYCSIAEGVKFILGGNHCTKGLSTYPFKVKLGLQKKEALTKGKIKIDDDVWIGMNAIILSGVTIGKGSVVGAGSVVTKSFPAYSIIGGNPATLLKKRFTEEVIEKLNYIDFKILDEKKIKNKIELNYNEINENNIDELLKEFS